jgi:hypothetical protein
MQQDKVNRYLQKRSICGRNSSEVLCVIQRL